MITTSVDATVAGLERSWDQATSGATPCGHDIEIAGRHLRVEAVGEAALAALWPALGHHPPANGEPDLVIRLWDLAATGADRPPLPEAMFHGDDTLHDTLIDGPMHVRFEPASRTLTAWDRVQSIAWCCVADAEDIVWWDRAAPFRSVLGWWLESRDVHLVHGAAVGDESGAVLLAGPGGSGKSTTALTAHLAGLGYLGDDYCAVSHTDGPRVHSLYGTAKLVLSDHDRSGALAGHLLRDDPLPAEKAVALVADIAGTRVVESAPVRAVVAARISPSGATRFVPSSRMTVLTALAPSSILQLPGSSGAMLSGLAALVRTAPVVGVLELGIDTDELLGVVGSLARGDELR